MGTKRKTAAITPEMVEAAKATLHAEAGDDIGYLADEDEIISMIEPRSTPRLSSSQKRDCRDRP